MVSRGFVCTLFVLLLFSRTATSAPPSTEGLNLASVNAAVAYQGQKELLFSKYPARSVPIASLTKLMTALVVMRSGESLNEWLEVYPRHRAAPNNAYSRIRIHSELKRGDMLRIALMSSENLAAYTLARHHPGGFDGFVEAMNATATELGMTQSQFVEPTGLSPRNRASAGDMIKLVNAVYSHQALRKYSTTGYFTARFRQPRYSLAYGNTNVLVHRGSWDVNLSKTGYLTEAGRCLVIVNRVEGHDVIAVLLDSFGTSTPIGDAGRIRRWLTTGQGGAIAEAARDYERQRNQHYSRAETQGTATSSTQ